MASEKRDTPGRKKPGNTNDQVGTHELQKRGVNVEQLLEKLIDAAGAEFTTYYYHTVLGMHLASNEEHRAICEDARLEDRAHFELITPRIYELGGAIPMDIRKFIERAAHTETQLPSSPTTLNILEVLLEAERVAIQNWSEVCDLTFGRDPQTYELAARILNEEIQHEAWFSALLAKERTRRPQHLEYGSLLRHAPRN